jgi:hypothetical protein
MAKTDTLQLAIAKAVRAKKVEYFAAQEFARCKHEHENPAAVKAEPQPAIPEHLPAMAKHILTAGETSEPKLNPAAYDDWQRRIQRRDDLRHGIDCGMSGMGSWENSFLQGEATNDRIVDSQLRQGTDVQSIAILVGRRVEDIAARKRELNQ